MSEDQVDETEASEEEASLDASFKVEASSLGEDEMDFAQALGFGDDGNEGASSVADDAVSDTECRAASEATDAATGVSEDGGTEAGEEVAETPAEDATEAASGETDESVDDAPAEAADEEVAEPDDGAEAIAAAAEDAEDDARDWEEIHPRPAAEGMQAELAARADEVLAADGGDASAAAGATASSGAGIDPALLSALESELAAARTARLDAEARLAERDQQLEQALSLATESGPQAELEKQIEALRSEFDAMALERDQAIDQLAVTQTRLAEAEDRCEGLRASLRTARSALIPLPEGERALRAEVLGLRQRLDDAAQENVRIAAEAASLATQLAIATARVEDRQHEVDFHLDRIETLDRTVAEKQAELDALTLQHREALALASRLQSENDELRSTQAALEETVQARDMEIAAREEQLRVTREGLNAREARILELGDRLDAADRRCAQQSAEAARLERERDSLLDRVARREARIAALSETLGRIEEAMGRRIPLATPTDEAGPPSEEAGPADSAVESEPAAD